MNVRCATSIALWLAFTSAAVAQQAGGPAAGQVSPQKSTSSTVMRSYPTGSAAPSRYLETRTVSGNREVVTETTEILGPDGKFRPSVEIATETVRTGTSSVRTKQDVFTMDGQGRRKLTETTQTEQEPLRGGISRTVENSWAADINGRLSLSEQRVEEVRSPNPNVKQTAVTIYRPGVNQNLQETERVGQTERQVSADLLETESTHFIRDANGRWQAIEARNQSVRKTGPRETVEEETIQRLDPNGALSLAERKITRRSDAPGRNELITETYSSNVAGVVRGFNSRQGPDERLRITTVIGADGSRQVIQELEARNPGAPNEPLRLVSRTIETVRPIGAGRSETQRQVFARDGSGRLVPVEGEQAETIEK